jgi:hypothetical protein
MEVPTVKTLLDRIRSAEVALGLISCPPHLIPTSEDTVTFREATFDSFGIPTFVPSGDQTVVRLTSVFDTHTHRSTAPRCAHYGGKSMEVARMLKRASK